MRNQIRISNLNVANNNNKKLNKVPIIWLIFQEINSIAGILLLRKYFKLNTINSTQESSSQVFGLDLPFRKTTFTEGTNRIYALSHFIKSASNVIWVVVILIIGISIWGSFSINQIKASSIETSSKIVEVTITEQIKPEISTEIASAMSHALVSAKASAQENLDRWKDESIERVDHPFLDWYYGYFTQWGIGLKAIFINLTSSNEDKASKLIEGFQKEFTKQVLQPELMQLQMERFTREAIDNYVAEVEHQLSGIQSTYAIPQPEWDRYLEGLGSVVYNTGNKKQNLTLRTISDGTAYVATGAMIKAVSVIGKTVATKTAVKSGTKAASAAATKIATKTATKVVAEGAGELTAGVIGLQLLNPIAGIGLLAWDIWDHYNTVKVDRPILKENIEKYLTEVEDSLLNDRDTGILSSVYKFHDGIMNSLSST